MTMMQYDKNNPFEATLVSRERLSSIDSSKDTQYLAFDIANSGIEYDPGDILAVLPKNDPKEVASILDVIETTSDHIVIDEHKITLAEALSDRFCITHLSKKFLQYFAECCVSEEDKVLLKNVILDKNANELFLQQNTLGSLIKKFKLTKIDSQMLIENLKKLSPRLYSIASSYHLMGDKLYLLVGAVKFEHENECTKLGVASNYLNTRLKIGEKAKTWVIPSKFKLPENIKSDVILIGPGTGLAPFISFIEEREYQKKLGEVGKTWLFFGDQHEKKEFYLREKILNWVDSSVLTKLDLAFSRDSDKKIYVQNRLLEHKKEVFNWLESGAYIYVCGDAKRMAVDVDNALISIVSECGSIKKEDAETYIKNLKTEKRYQRDVY